jgi:uncharacterized protein YcgL (UPF0745 family)
MYIFVGEQVELPDELMDSLGELTFVMDLQLEPDTKLANSKPEDVLKSIDEKGFYLQIPPVKDYLILP